jgi:hypothetical protein
MPLPFLSKGGGFFLHPGLNNKNHHYRGYRYRPVGVQYKPAYKAALPKKPYYYKQRRTHNKIKEQPYRKYIGKARVAAAKAIAQRHGNKYGINRKPYKIQGYKYMKGGVLKIYLFHWCCMAKG